MASELTIRINADAKNAIKAFDDVKAKTKELDEVTSRAALVAGAAFAALSAEVFFSVRAFSEAEQSSNRLTQALQNQGIYSDSLKESYEEVAKAVSVKTGIDDDQLVAAQAVAQSYLGQSVQASVLTQAIADLGTKYGSVEQAATVLGKSIGTKTNALARDGLVLKDNLTENERLAKVLEFTAAKFGGQAEAANKASFGMNGLKVAVEDIQEEIGKRFAPTIELVATALTGVARAAKDNSGLFDFIAAVITGTTVLAGVVLVVAAAVKAYAIYSAAAAAAGVATTIGFLPFIAAGIAIVAVGAAIFDLANNFNLRMAQIKAVAIGAATSIIETFGGIKDAITALLTGNFDGLEKAFDRVNQSAATGQKAFAKSLAEGTAALVEEGKKQDAAAKVQADKEQAEKRRIENLEQASLRANNQVKLAQLRGLSTDTIKLYQEEAAIRKNLIDEQNAAVIAASISRIAQLQALEAEANAQELERFFAFQAEKAAAIADTVGDSADPASNPEMQARLDALSATMLTEEQIESQSAEERLKNRIAANNLFLKSQQDFGTSYAKIQKILNSDEAKAAGDAANELVGLAQSKNATLKAIGKAAALTQIAIATATSATKVFADAVVLLGPFAGPPVGAALAAARIAYGAEQAANVVGAQTGALVGGSGRGDTQPFMLEPGELVAPRRNFNEVIEGVQTERSGVIDKISAALDAGGVGGGTQVAVTVQGDFYGEESFIDKLTKNISDAIEYRNTRFVGVNT